MADLETVVIGTFDVPENARRAADELRSAGFTNNEMMLVGRQSEQVSSSTAASTAQSGTDELHSLLEEWSVRPEVARRVTANVGGARGMLVLRPGARQQDAIRILKDFGARIFGNVSDADWEAENARIDYDTDSGTRDTLRGAADTPTDELGARTGEQVTWDEAHPRYRADWQQRTGGTEEQWTAAEPSYRYAHEMRQQPGYANQDWASAEPQLRSNYSSWAQQSGYHVETVEQDEGLWDKIKHIVEEAWEHVPGVGGHTSHTQVTGSTSTSQAQAVQEPQQRERWVRMTPEDSTTSGGTTTGGTTTGSTTSGERTTP